MKGMAWFCHLSGFSLIELVISMGILTVGLLGAMRVFPLGLRASRRTEMNSRATILAQRTLEALKLEGWEELTIGERKATEDPFDVTTRLRTLQLDSVVDPERVREVVVTVRWDEDERPRSLSFMTYIRRDNGAT